MPQPQRHALLLLLLAILGFFGVRHLKPFYEGYREYSGPGSMASTISWLSRDIDRFKKDHDGNPPSPRGMWDIMLGTSDSTELGDTPATGTSFGPYLPFGLPPTNELNGQSAVADKPGPGVGWVYTVKGTDFKLSAVNATGTAVFTDDEARLYYFRPSERAHVASQRAWNNWAGLLFSIPLVIHLSASLLLLRSRERARRKAQGLCLTCGYDLRASPNRCPECGTPILPASSPVMSPYAPHKRATWRRVFAAVFCPRR